VKYSRIFWRQKARVIFKSENIRCDISPFLRGALIIAVVSFAVWKKCCAQAPQTAHVQLPPTHPVPQQPLPEPQLQVQTLPQPQPLVKIQQQPPPAYSQQNPTFNFKQPMAPVLIYT
jgi:hypothetical protein